LRADGAKSTLEASLSVVSESPALCRNLMASVWRKPDRIVRPEDGTFVLELETFDGGFLQLSISRDKGFTSYYKTKRPLGTAARNNSRTSIGGLLGRLGPTAS